MAKSIITDGVVAVMHFNSSVPAYHHARASGISTIECCYCYKPLGWQMPATPGQSTRGNCPECGNTLGYRTIVLPEAIAAHFDVRGGTMYGSPLVTGGVMHIALPERHREFDALVQRIIAGVSNVVPASSPEVLLKDITARVVNDVRARVSVRCDQAIEAHGRVTDRNLAAIGNAFDRFGKVFVAQEVEYPTEVRQRVTFVVETLSRELDQHLTALVQDPDVDLRRDLMRTCVHFIYTAIHSRFRFQLNLPSGPSATQAVVPGAPNRSDDPQPAAASAPIAASTSTESSAVAPVAPSESVPPQVPAGPSGHVMEPSTSTANEGWSVVYLLICLTVLIALAVATGYWLTAS